MEVKIKHGVKFKKGFKKNNNPNLGFYCTPDNNVPKGCL